MNSWNIEVPLQMPDHSRIKQKPGYSGGFKQLARPKPPTYTVIKKHELSKQDVYKQFGIVKTKNNDIEQILPHSSHLPKTKQQLITLMVENIQHKLNKIRYQREANVYF